VDVEWKTFDAFRARGGRFKIPFGLETTTGISELDFAYRALGSTEISPGRDRGFMAFGDLGHFNYEVGVFDDDGDNAKSNAPQFVRSGQDVNHVGPAVAARIVGDLFRSLPVGKLKSANVGVAYTVADLPEGLYSLRGESVWGTNITDRVYVKGLRQRIGTQFEWSPGSHSVKAEWMQAREQRKEQSNRDQDLSDAISTAWYVSGTWFITGEKKDNNIKIKHPVWKGGPGAIELAARIENITFESATKTGTPFANPRADYLLPNSDMVLTMGVNWTTSRWTRMQFDAIHEDIDDVNRAPNKGESSFWSTVVRLNIVF
jgi:phosphate-selective porin